MDSRSNSIAGVPDFELTPDFLTADEEATLSACIATWKFNRVPMRGGYLRRQMLCFGVDFGPNFLTLREAPPLPRELHELRARCAVLAGCTAEDLTQAIVQLYPPGAGIGWHNDDPRLGPVVIGVSLASDATLRFTQRRSAPPAHILKVTVPARSAYVMRGQARDHWLHSLSAVRRLRFSITFRAAGSLESPSL